MKNLIFVLVFFLASCGQEPMNDIVIGTKGIENSWNKATSDARSEGDRLVSRTNKTLVKTNMDVVNEEHKFNQRAKDTGAKANSDVLDEEARTTGRVKDTLAKANSDVLDTAEKTNMDVVEEEHRFNDRVKDTAEKTNMDVVEEEHKFNQRTKDTSEKANSDFNDEKERFKDDVLGTDEGQIESNDRRITELERQAGLNAALLALQSKRVDLLESAVKSLQDKDAELTSAINGGLEYASSKISDLYTKLTTLTVSDIEGLNEQLDALDTITNNYTTNNYTTNNYTTNNYTTNACSVTKVAANNSQCNINGNGNGNVYWITITCGVNVTSFCSTFNK